MFRKFMVVVFATAALLVAAQAEATGFRSRTVVRSFGGFNNRRVVVNSFATPVFVQPQFFQPTFVQPQFVPIQPNVFVPVNGFNSFGFQVNAFGGGFCH